MNLSELKEILLSVWKNHGIDISNDRFSRLLYFFKIEKEVLEDIIQETFIMIFHRFKESDENDKVFVKFRDDSGYQRNYIIKSIKNASIDYLRMRSARKDLIVREINLEELMEGEDDTMHKLKLECFYAQILTLQHENPSDAQLWGEKEINGLSYKELSSTYSKETRWLTDRVSKINKKLRERIEKNC